MPPSGSSRTNPFLSCLQWVLNQEPTTGYPVDMASENAKPVVDVRYVDPVIEVYKRDVDRTLIRHMLKMTPEQRLLSLQACLEDVIEMREAMKRASRR